jgi:hypothetical protein
MVESFLSGKKARSPIMGITGVRGITGLMGWGFGSTGIGGYTGGFDLAAGYTGYEGSTGYAGYTGVSGSTGIRGWSIFDRGSSNFFNASWVADPADDAHWDPMAYPTYTDGGTSSFIRVDITGTGPEAFLAGTKARVGKPFLQGLTDFLRRWNFPGAGL